ncbi:MAG: hypothetical protein ACMXX7_00935 [Candidatus Woesearchaeota archaeon]
MKKMLLLLGIIILISGCSLSQGPTVENYRTGNQGITAEFTNNLPPTTIREEQEVLISLDVWNRGAENVEVGHIELNYDGFYFSKVQGPNILRETNIEVMGKGPGFSTGGRNRISLGALRANQITSQIQNPSTRISASICYPYKTVFSQEVCMDRDILETQDNPVCRNTPRRTYSGQGAPIVVSSLETEMVPVARYSQDSFLLRPEFTITVRNAGRGNPYSLPFALTTIENACTNPNSISGININEIEVIGNIANLRLTCDNNNIVKLVGGEGKITCRIDNEGSLNTLGPVPPGFNPNQIFEVANNYVEILNIELEYLYKDYVSKEVSIRR